MSRLLVFAIFGVLFINISCERCMRCTYSYTETVIVETPNGEEEEIIEHVNQILPGEDGTPYGEECFKYKEYKGKDKDNIFSINTYYELEGETTDLDNYEFNCARI